MIGEDGCLWNAGIFCFRASWLIDEVRKIHPAVVEAVSRSVREGATDLGAFIPSDAFEAAEAISFDHGFMEHTDAAVVVPADFSWSDVGDWNAVWTASEKDKDGVASRGDVVNLRSKNTLVHATHRMVCTVGVSNIAVIETPDAVLVISLDEAQGVKELVKHLESQHRPEALEHLRSYRPWGWYQTMDLGERFRVKRICVKPGAKLSLQKHYHRSEHWTLVRGTADIIIGHEARRLHENESVYIPQGAIHRLSNPGKIPIEMVEVQTGCYLEEDDIERIEDDFGRVEPLIQPHQIAAE